MKSRYFSEEVKNFEDIPNVGRRVARDFRKLGFSKPIELLGKDPFALYMKLNKLDGKRHDPCLLDVFMSVADYVSGSQARPWWFYTKQRKMEYFDRY